VGVLGWNIQLKQKGPGWPRVKQFGNPFSTTRKKKKIPRFDRIRIMRGDEMKLRKRGSSNSSLFFKFQDHTIFVENFL